MAMFAATLFAVAMFYGLGEAGVSVATRDVKDAK